MIQYRRLRKGDIKQVQDVALKSWKYTYKRIYSARTIGQRVSLFYSDDSFRRFVFPRIRKGQECFYVALSRGRVIGFCAVGKSMRARKGWRLYRIYLEPAYMGKGIGKRLLTLSEQFLRRKKAGSYSLYVHSKNKMAKRFYLKNGFIRAAALDMGRTEVCFIKFLKPRQGLSPYRSMRSPIPSTRPKPKSGSVFPHETYPRPRG